MEQLLAPIAQAMGIRAAQAKAVLQLLEEGCTVPFIARYRKERSGGLDEEQIRQIEEAYRYQVNLTKRKEDVLRLIEQQGHLSEEVRRQLAACTRLSQVEDVYRPYQQKRKTRAKTAVANGLQPLAEWLLAQREERDVKQEAARYRSEAVPDEAAALQGAKDIIAERVSDDAKVRSLIRRSMEQYGRIVSKAKAKHDDAKQVYQMYYDYSERIESIQPHRVMAIERGEKEGVLQVTLSFNKDYVRERVQRRYIRQPQRESGKLLQEAIDDGLQRLAYPSVEREVRKSLSERAQAASIDVFSMNVERLLSQPPLKGRWILGFDPAYRTGCKLAVIDETGKLRAISVIYPHPPKADQKGAKKELLRLLQTYPIGIIAIGNGTASRESEAFVARMIQEEGLSVAFTLVSEAGASVYSASPLAKTEFPDLQVEQRSAVSIARRILDPLAELIKIDPQSLGVGQYQHDLAQAKLKERLSFAVSKVVNRVGVDVNTASVELLRYISGLNAATAQSLVQYREEHGRIKSRQELRRIPRIGARTFEQAAGFLRVADGAEWLDRTGIHPESYALAKAVLRRLGLEPAQMGSKRAALCCAQAQTEALCEELQADAYTIRDILEAIAAPLKDYRDQYPKPLLKSNVLSIDDLRVGDELQGTVRNVVDFGAFVDIGLHEDGLVHISKMRRTRVAHPKDVVSIGDIVTVWVYKIEPEKQKVQLSLIPLE